MTVVSFPKVKADPPMTTAERFKANRSEAYARATLGEAANVTKDAITLSERAVSLLKTAVAQQPRPGSKTPTERDKTVLDARAAINVAIEHLQAVLGELQ